MNKQLLISKRMSITEKAILVLISLIFLILMSQLKVYINSLVPITGQTLAILLIALSLPSDLSLVTVIIYIFLGAINVPVFAGFSKGFFLNIPTGGYILGFLVSTIVIGYFADRGYTKNVLYLIPLILLFHVIVYSLGLFMLSRFVSKNLLQVGLTPFIIGDILKSIIVVVILPLSWKIKKYVSK